jgi:hypothetical protein
MHSKHPNLLPNDNAVQQSVSVDEMVLRCCWTCIAVVSACCNMLLACCLLLWQTCRYRAQIIMVLCAAIQHELSSMQWGTEAVLLA